MKQISFFKTTFFFSCKKIVVKSTREKIIDPFLSNPTIILEIQNEPAK